MSLSKVMYVPQTHILENKIFANSYSLLNSNKRNKSFNKNLARKPLASKIISR